MSFSKQHIRSLERTIKSIQDLVAQAKKPALRDARAPTARTRRTGKELAAFKKAAVAELKRGASVAELAKKYGVTSAYIYQLRPAAPSKAKAYKTTGVSNKGSSKKAKVTKPAPTSGAVKENAETLAA